RQARVLDGVVVERQQALAPGAEVRGHAAVQRGVAQVAQRHGQGQARAGRVHVQVLHGDHQRGPDEHRRRGQVHGAHARRAARRRARDGERHARAHGRVQVAGRRRAER
ncbi:hypothetical protein EG864_15765, partial [Enterococcus faecalis]